MTSRPRRLLHIALVLLAVVTNEAIAATSAPALPFVDRLWRVTTGSDVPTGAYYVFLSDGTLLITSPHATPAVGAWRPGATARTITLVEESIAYRTEVVSATAERLVLRLHPARGTTTLRFQRVHGR